MNSKIDSDIETTKYVANIAFAYKHLNIFLGPLGLQKCNYNAGHPVKISALGKAYACLVSLAVLGMGGLLTATSLTSSSYFEKNHLADTSHAIKILEIVSSSFTSAVAVLTSAYLSSGKFSKMINSFDSLDMRLGIINQRHYTTIKMKIYLAVFLYLSLICVRFVHDLTTGIMSDSYSVYISHLMDVPETINTVEFSIVLFIITSRFAFLNDRMEAYLNELPDGFDAKYSPLENLLSDFRSVKLLHLPDKNKKDGFKKKVRTDRLLALMKIFDGLADNVHIVNDCYGISLLLLSVTSFLYIIASMNGLILFGKVFSSEEQNSVSIIMMKSVPIMTVLIVGCYTSEELKSQTEKLSITLDKISINANIDEEEHELLVCFSQMISERNVFITANNFFAFDFSFVFSLVGAVATYSVILLQVNHDDPAKGQSTNITSNATN